MHCRMFSRIASFYPLGCQVGTIKNVSRHCQMSPGWGAGGKTPSLVEDTQAYPECTITLFFSEVLGRGGGHADPDKREAKCQHVGYGEGRGSGEGVL